MHAKMPAIFRRFALMGLILAAIVLGAAGAQAQERASETPQEMLVQAKAEMRKERSDKSAVVAVLAPGEKVLAGLPRDGWLAVFRQGTRAVDESAAMGFLPAGLLKALPGPEAHAVAVPTGPSQKPKVQPAAKEGTSGQSQLMNKQEPVRVTSDKLTYKQAESAVVFEGNVHATHADMALWANKLTAYFVDKKKAQAGKDPSAKDGGDFSDKIERIVAEGNVRMVSGKNEGFCGKLTYFVPESTLRMDDNPILREGTSTVRGEIIKYFLKENRSEVIGGSQRRVEAIFQSTDNKPGGGR